MRAAAVALSIALLLPSSALAYDYTSLADNTWTLVESGGMTDPAGTAKAVRGILAYSGMAYDSDHNTLLVFGGGHCDYAGNEVWKFDIASATWTQMYSQNGGAPDPATLCPTGYDTPNYPTAIFNPPGEALSETQPLTRHTYDTDEWIPGVGLFTTGLYTWGSSINYGAGTFTPCSGYATPCYTWGGSDTWTYSPTTNKWTWRNASQDAQPSGLSCAAYDPVTGLVFINERTDTYTYNPTTDHWTKLTTTGSPIGSNESGMDYDSSRHVMWRFGGTSSSTNDLWKYDITANTWTKMTPSGTAPGAAGGYGVAYDTANDVLIVVRGSGSANTYVYDPTANSWTNMSPASPPPSIGDIHGDLKYDTADNVTFLVTYSGFTVQTWAYRYAAGTPADVTAPAAPAGMSAHRGF